MPRKATTSRKTAAEVDPLSQLMNSALDPTPQTAAKKKSDKSVITCSSPEEAEALDHFTSSDAILKVAQGTQAAAKLQVHEIFRPKYLRQCIKAGCKPENPVIQSPSSRANYVVKHVSKISTNAAGGSDPKSVPAQLLDLGFSQEAVNDITSRVLTEKTTLGLRDFTELTAAESTELEKKVGQKLMKLVLDNFTAEEKRILLVKTLETTIDKGWQDVAVQTACNSVPKNDPDYEEKAADMLGKLYSVLPPQFVLSQMTYSGDLSKAFDGFKDGGVASKPITLKKDVYRGVITGNVLEFFIGDDTLLGKKNCENPDHAKATFNKLVTQPDYLQKFINDNKKK